MCMNKYNIKLTALSIKAISRSLTLSFADISSLVRDTIFNFSI